MTCVQLSAEKLRTDRQAWDPILHQLYGLSETERRVFGQLVKLDDPIEVDDLAEKLGRSRTTIYRSLTHLVEADLLEQQRHCFEDGGYCHRYQLPPAEQLVTDFYRHLNRQFQSIDNQIESFANDECFPPS